MNLLSWSDVSKSSFSLQEFSGDDAFEGVWLGLLLAFEFSLYAKKNLSQKHIIGKAKSERKKNTNRVFLMAYKPKTKKSQIMSN